MPTIPRVTVGSQDSDLLPLARLRRHGLPHRRGKAIGTETVRLPPSMQRNTPAASCASRDLRQQRTGRAGAQVVGQRGGTTCTRGLLWGSAGRDEVRACRRCQHRLPGVREWAPRSSAAEHLLEPDRAPLGAALVCPRARAPGVIRTCGDARQAWLWALRSCTRHAVRGGTHGRHPRRDGRGWIATSRTARGFRGRGRYRRSSLPLIRTESRR